MPLMSSAGRRVVSRSRHQTRKPACRQRSIGILEQCEKRTLLTTMFGVTAASALVQFDSASPTIIGKSNPITNIGDGETIQGIDYRPANGQLYALTTDANHTGRLYTINTASAVATLASTIDVPVTGTRFGLDFNPIPDRLRVVSDTDLNLRIDVTTGVATADGTLAYLAGDPSAGQNPNVVGSAYSNNFSGTSATTLYQIDSNLGILAIQNPPNNGTLTTVGPLGVDASEVVGFDIQTIGGQNIGYATLVVGGTTNLYQINLSTGAATLIAPVGAPVSALAIAPVGFRSKIEGSSVILTGSDSVDRLVIDQSGGLLRHNQFALGVPGYNSEFDFDSSLPGDQTINATDASISVFVNAQGSNDRVILGSASAPLSSLSPSFRINLEDGQNNQLILDDSASEIAKNITIAPILVPGLTANAMITGFGTTVRVSSSYGSSTYLAINAGNGNDTFHVAESFPLSGFLTSLSGGGGSDTLIADAVGASVSAGLTTLVFHPLLTYTVTVNYASIEQVNIVNVSGRPILPVPPSVATISQATAGTEFTNRLVAQFEDFDPGAKAADYQVMIQWGDGTSSAGTVVQNANNPNLFEVYGSHRYLASGNFTITTTIHDTGGSFTLSGPVYWVQPLGSHLLTLAADASPTVTVTTTYQAEQAVAITSQVLVIDPPIAVAGRLDPASDTGLSDQDGITNDNTPTFTGTTSPGAVVRIYNGTDPANRQLIATAIADANGAWQATVLSPLADGSYTNLILEATSSNGRVSASNSLATLMVDTVAPTVTNLEFRRINGQIQVFFQDDRSGLNQAQLANLANYVLTGKALGARRIRQFPITGVTATSLGTPANAYAVNLAINNGQRLRAGRYTFTARSGGIEDLAGNALNGTFTGRFPSGNAQPEGNFVAGLRPLRRIVAVSNPNDTGAANSAGNRQTAAKKNSGNTHPSGPNQGAHLANRPHAAASFKAQGRKLG